MEIEKELVNYLSRYLRIDTTNPPGNEEKAAEFLETMLGKEGIPSNMYFQTKSRPNLLARLRGNGEKKPVMLLHHMDVVEANYDNAFSGKVENGYVHGRGALDMKGFGVMQLMTVLLVKRNNLQLKRDLIFLAVSDEESGGSEGMEYMVVNHFDKIDSEYALSEGSLGVKGLIGDGIVYSCAIADKAPLWLRLISEGQSGHGSIPIKDSAVNQMIKALENIRCYEPDIRFTKETKEFFKKLGSLQKFPKSMILKNIYKKPCLALVKKGLTSEKLLNTILRDTVSVTSLKAGKKENVIPERCEATLDCRLLPGKKPSEFVEELKGAINDRRIKFELIRGEEAASSSTNTEFYKALEDVLNNPLVPVVSPYITDLRFLRKKGVSSYGLTPIVLTKDEVAMIHGNDEKISVKNLVEGTKKTYELIKKICT